MPDRLVTATRGPARPGLPARGDPPVGPVAGLLRDRDRPQPGLRQHVRGRRRARRLQRGVPDPRDRPRRPRRGRPDRAVRADLQPAPPRRRRRAGERLRADGADRRGRGHDHRQHRDLPRRAVAGRRRRRGLRPGDPGRSTSSCSGSTAWPRSCSRRRSRSARSSSPTADSSSTRSPRSCTRPGSSCSRSCSPTASGSSAIGLGRRRRRRGAPGDPGDRHDPDVVPDPAGVRGPDRRRFASSSG